MRRLCHQLMPGYILLRGPLDHAALARLARIAIASRTCAIILITAVLRTCMHGIRIPLLNLVLEYDIIRSTRVLNLVEREACMC